MAGFDGRLIPEVKSLGDDGTFEGVLSTYGNIDLVGDIVEAGAFAKSLAEQGSTRQLLRDHDWSRIIGTFDVTDSTDALRIKGRICLDTADGRETWALMKFGALDGLSIGYYASKYHYDQDGIRHLDELDLREGSVVGDPANPLARIQAKSRRLARMSRYAKCAFLSKMTPEERDEALAELDRVDAEAEEDSKDTGDDENVPVDEEDSKDGEGEESPEETEDKDEGEEESEDKEDPDTEDESEDKEDDAIPESLIETLRGIGKDCESIIERLEG